MQKRKNLHRAFVIAQQESDGGFSGREGDSDLYYTGFAVRSLAVLGGLTPNECESITPYVKSHISNSFLSST